MEDPYRKLYKKYKRKYRLEVFGGADARAKFLERVDAQQRGEEETRRRAAELLGEQVGEQEEYDISPPKLLRHPTSLSSDSDSGTDESEAVSEEDLDSLSRDELLKRLKEYRSETRKSGLSRRGKLRRSKSVIAAEKAAVAAHKEAKGAKKVVADGDRDRITKAVQRASQRAKELATAHTVVQKAISKEEALDHPILQCCENPVGSKQKCHTNSKQKPCKDASLESHCPLARYSIGKTANSCKVPISKKAKAAAREASINAGWDPEHEAVKYRFA